MATLRSPVLWGSVWMIVVWVTLAQAATIRVTTSLDEWKQNTKCSLREAIHAANTDTRVGGCPRGNGADLIQVPAGTYPLYDTLTVTSTLTLRGAGPERTILRAAPESTHIRSPLMVIAPEHDTARALVERVTICCVGSHEASRPVIMHHRGRLVLRDSVIRDTVLAGAGAVSVQPGAQARIVRSVLERNVVPHIPTADDMGWEEQGGGGLYNAGTLYVLQSIIRANTSTIAGAGVHNRPGAVLVIDWSTFEDNEKLTPLVANGGGGGIWNFLGTVTITRSTIHHNGAGQGGGLLNVGGTMTLHEVLVVGNNASVDGATGGLVNTGTVDEVGAILAPTLAVTESVILGNTTLSDPTAPTADCAVAYYPPQVWTNNLTGVGTGCPEEQELPEETDIVAQVE